MDKPELTERQKDVLGAIEQLIEEGDQSPTLREIAEYFDQPRASSVRYTVEALNKKGYIHRERDPKRDRYAARGISILHSVDKISEGVTDDE